MADSGHNAPKGITEILFNKDAYENKESFGGKGIVFTSPISHGIRAVVTNGRTREHEHPIPLMKFVIRRQKFSPYYYKNWFNYTEVTALIRLLQRMQCVMEDCLDGTLDLKGLLEEDEDFGLRLENMQYSPHNPFQAIIAKNLACEQEQKAEARKLMQRSLERARRHYEQQEAAESGTKIEKNLADELLTEDELKTITEEIDKEDNYE